MLQEQYKSDIPLYQLETDLYNYRGDSVWLRAKSRNSSGYLHFCSEKFEFAKKNSNDLGWNHSNSVQESHS